MLGRLILLFLLTPAIELGLLIQVDKLIGFWPTIGLIIATGLAGSYLAKREGISTWNRLNERLGQGGLPGKELVDGVIILIAGALLITPGVLTDVVGFMGLLPPTRALIRKLVLKRIQKKMEEGALKMQFGFYGGSAPGPGGPAGWSDGPGGPNGSQGGPSRGGSSAGGSSGGGSRSGDASQGPRQRDAGWEGAGRDVPGHVEEIGEAGSGRDERDAV